MITFKFNCYLDYSKPKVSYSDYESMRELAISNREEEYMAFGSNKNVEELWNILKSKLMMGKFVPQVKSLGKPTWRVKGSFPKQLQDAIRGKHTTHRHWMSARKGVMPTPPPKIHP